MTWSPSWTLHRVLGAPVILVWDNLATHRSRWMRAAIQAQQWLEVEYLFSYAPDLLDGFLAHTDLQLGTE